MFIRSEPEREREVASRTSLMSVLLEAITCHIVESKKKEKSSRSFTRSAGSCSSLVFRYLLCCYSSDSIRAKPDFRMADPTQLLVQCTQVFFFVPSSFFQRRRSNTTRARYEQCDHFPKLRFLGQAQAGVQTVRKSGSLFFRDCIVLLHYC